MSSPATRRRRAAAAPWAKRTAGEDTGAPLSAPFIVRMARLQRAMIAAMTTFQAPRVGERMLPVEEAQQRVLEEVRLLGTEQVAFTEAHGRVLREDVRSPDDVPQGDNTAMDGYAVRAEDIASRR